MTPTAAPALAIAPHAASAAVRWLPSYVVVTIDSAPGVSIAAPRPCAARAPISASGEGARPLASDASVKSASPARKTRRCPNRSVARPPSISSPPVKRTYAVITHCRSPSENARSSAIDGSATLTTVMSRVTMNCARPSRTSVVQGFRSDSGSVVSARCASRSIAIPLRGRAREPIIPPRGTSPSARDARGPGRDPFRERSCSGSRGRRTDRRSQSRPRRRCTEPGRRHRPRARPARRRP